MINSLYRTKFFKRTSYVFEAFILNMSLSFSFEFKHEVIHKNIVLSPFHGDAYLSEMANPHRTPTVRILSLDGGGIRGVIEARILARIEQITGRPIQEMFHIIGGTSAGGLLAILLTIPSEADPTKPKYTAQQAFEILYNNILGLFSPNPFSFNGLFGPKYDTNHFNTRLTSYIGTYEMKQSVLPTVVTAYNLTAHQTTIFSSFETGSIKAKDAAIATSAAPFLFHPHQIAGQYYADGAIGANDPASLLLSSALNLFKDAKRFEIISIGSGQDDPFKHLLQQKPHHFHSPILDFAPKISKIITSSQRTGVENYLDQLMNVHEQDLHASPNIREGGIYVRLNPVIEDAPLRKFDNFSKKNLDSLISLTDLYLYENDEKFSKLTQYLQQEKTKLDSSYERTSLRQAA